MENETRELEPSPSNKSAKDERRDAIVAIAHATFIANGYAGTSMSTIAARLGGSKGTLYNYFKSKEQLFVAVVEKKCAQILGLMNEAEIKSGGDLRATLTDFGEHFLELVLNADSIATFRLAVAESDRFPEIGQAMYSSGVSQNLRRVTEFLHHAQEGGQLRRDVDVAVAAEQFLDLCLTGIHRKRLLNVIPEPDAADVRANVANAVSTFMRAFGV
jgi:TetR/AcrR family transcriptional regulator, mexJK operon transcriptional repressor